MQFCKKKSSCLRQTYRVQVQVRSQTVQILDQLLNGCWFFLEIKHRWKQWHSVWKVAFNSATSVCSELRLQLVRERERGYWSWNVAHLSTHPPAAKHAHWQRNTPTWPQLEDRKLAGTWACACKLCGIR
jgi:hypothetical protein